jgi:DNA-binding transcriptional LysR family regulator
MLHEYPDINVEIGIDYALTDIVAQRAAIDGFGIAFIPEELASVHLANGLLEPVLENWWPTSAGFHLYYSGRRESSPAFAVVVEALRYRAYA